MVIDIPIQKAQKWKVWRSHSSITAQSRDFIIPVKFSRSVVSDSLRCHGLHHGRLPCPSPTSGVYSNSCPLSRWGYPTISSSVVPFSSCLQSFPASESFPVSQLFVSGGWSIEVSASASVLPVNIQDWFPLGLTGLISLQSKGFSIYDDVITLTDNGVCTYAFFCALESSELIGLRY